MSNPKNAGDEQTTRNAKSEKQVGGEGVEGSKVFGVIRAEDVDKITGTLGGVLTSITIVTGVIGHVTLTIWLGSLATLCYVVAGIWHGYEKSWRPRLISQNPGRATVIAVIVMVTGAACTQWIRGSAPAPPTAAFSARVKTIMIEADINRQPFFFAVVPFTDVPTAYAVSATMYLQLRNADQSTCMIDSYCIEAKSDRGNWEAMQIWDVPGPGGDDGERIYTFDDPKQANRMEPAESFTDAVKKRNLQPGETIQGLIFLTMPRDWMAGEYRIRIMDSAGEESLIPITFDMFATNATVQAQLAAFNVIARGVDVSAYKFVRPGRSTK